MPTRPGPETTSPPEETYPLPDGLVRKRIVLVTSEDEQTQSGYAIGDDIVVTVHMSGIHWGSISVSWTGSRDALSAEVLWTGDGIVVLRCASPAWHDAHRMPAVRPVVSQDTSRPCVAVGFQPINGRPTLQVIGGLLHENSRKYTLEIGALSEPIVPLFGGAPVLTTPAGELAGLFVETVIEGEVGAVVTVAPITERVAAAIRDAVNPPAEPAESPAPAPNDQVQWQPDAPTTKDVLRRGALAKAIADRLVRRTDEDPTSFLILLDGRWGSGKSSVMRMVEERLQKKKWTVVRYDAWRLSQFGRPWWTLLNAVRGAVRDTMGRPRRGWLRLRELWRVRMARTPAVLALFLVVAVALGLFLALRPARLDLTSVGTVTQTVAAAVTAIGTLFAGAAVSARFLLWGSARGARYFEETAENPLTQVAEHMGWLIDRLDRPLLVLVDDVDRCPASEVVELLESLQTLLRDAPPPDRDTAPHPIAIIVAADSAWLHSAFEQEYAGFGGAVGELGRPLGYLFCDKIFQLVVPMPGLGTVGQNTFLASLLGSAAGAAEAAMPGQVDAARSRLAASGSEAEVLAALDDAPQAVREQVAPQAVEALTRLDVAHTAEHTLGRFAALLPANPRSMKRFVNDYSMARAVRTLEGDPVPVDALAQWVVIRTRWPVLATHLAEHPEEVLAILDADATGAPSTEELGALYRHPEVRRAVSFGEGTTLTPELVRRCCGEPTPAR